MRCGMIDENTVLEDFQMKKYFFTVIIFLLLLTGCGHKSKEDLTDIEQFRCQDSIQTVFDVLGEIEIENNVYIGECYTYENLNLYGYDGEAIFRVRDDKDTISSFECSLKLDKKEFMDVLSQLEDRYGESEKSEYSNQIAYVWEIVEGEAKEIGYNRISLSDYGDKKVYIRFSDEWSNKKDEAYYQYLEEEKEVNILAQKTYKIGEDTFDFSFGQKGNGEYSFTLLCKIEDKADAYMTHISLNAIFNSDEEAIKALTDTMNFSYGMIIGDGTSLTRTKGILFILSKDGEMIKAEDYFPVEWVLEENVTKSDYGTQVTNFLVDFIENE